MEVSGHGHYQDLSFSMFIRINKIVKYYHNMQL